tara:strand:+ start:3802 stop:4257 length:456 start_codon:yes stop_codon:yes gene_type:complete
MSGRVIIISGYFNPIHSGHLDYIESAREKCDHLIVIVNNDKQVEMKGRVQFMCQEERLRIVSSIKGVDKAVLSIDEDSTVCQTIRQEHNKLQYDPFVQSISFGNGGDRKEGGIAEEILEEELDIIMLYNLGGEKTQSSSNLIEKVGRHGTI